MSDKQPEALRLADALTTLTGTQKDKHTTAKQAAAELRRLHEALEMNARTIAMYENEQLDDEDLMIQVLKFLNGIKNNAGNAEAVYLTSKEAIALIEKRIEN